MSFIIKRGDTLTPFSAVLTDSNDNPIDLNNYQEVRLRLKDRNGNIYLDKVAQTTANAGEIQYVFQYDEVDIDGIFTGVAILIDNNDRAIVPNSGMFTIGIFDDFDIVTPQEVRERWCFGLPLTKSNGEIMNDIDIKIYIYTAIKEVERRLGIFLRPTKIVCNPIIRDYPDHYDLAEPPYDYNLKQYRHWGFLQLRQYPIISVDKVQLVLPNFQSVVDFPMDWVKVYPKVGQLNIVPYAGSPTVMTVAGAAGTAFPFLTGQFSRNFPQAIWVDYTAGLAEVPEDLRSIVAKLAAIDVLGIAGDAILAGIASVGTSVDGMSENFSTTASATNATYGARILQLRGEVADFFNVSGAKGERGGGHGGARTYYKGFTMKIL